MREPRQVEKMKAVDALMNCIEREGVEYIFGVPGAALTPIYESLLNRPRLRHILAKHEEGAAFMAAGYARVRRGLGVCCATTGPGGTNALTGIACAQAESTPVLLLTGQSPLRSFGKNALQESTKLGLDLVDVFRPVTKLSVMVPTEDRVQQTTQRAIRTALTGRPGPVHLSLPADILNHEVDVERLEPWQYRPEPRPVDRDAAAEAARLLVSAERPCILAGDGVAVSGAWAALAKLAHRLKIPVATTPKGKGVFPENDPLSLGVFGFGGHPRAEAFLLADYVDVLLVVGTSMGEFSTLEWEDALRPSRAFLQIDIDPNELGKNYPIDVGITGDARAALEELDEQVEALLAGRTVTPVDALTGLREQVQHHIGTEYRDAPDSPLKPQRVIDEMQAVLPEDALLFIDSGNSIMWAGHYFEARRPNTYFLHTGLASMGVAGPAAIGGKLAAPDKICVALVGDAAFAMNGMEVHTAADHGISVIWVVLNNQGHGMVYHGEKMMRGDHLNACKFNVLLDIAQLATAMGARAFKVHSGTGFRAALEEAMKTRGPSVIDAHIDAEEVPYLLLRRARSVARSFDNLPPSLRVPKWVP